MRKSAIYFIMLAFILTLGLSGTAAADNTGLSGNSSNVHWAQAYQDDLNQCYAINNVLGDFDLDQEIPMLELEKLLKAVFKEDINFETTHREEVVSKLVDLGAAKTGIDLNELLFIALIPFDDFNDIHPDYSRNIMYAYSTGQIKGRGSNQFEPLRNITYGEAMVMTKRLEDAIREGAFFVQANVIRKGDTVTFDFALVNKSNINQSLSFPAAQLFDAVVWDNTGTEVYRYSENQMFAQVQTDRTLAPGESIAGSITWNVTDKQGQALAPGRYTVELSFVPKGSPISAVINFEY